MVMRTLGIITAILFIILTGCRENIDTQIKVETLVETTKSWNGDLLPPYPQGQPKVTILKITIPPKTKLKPHLHPVINSGVMLKGKLLVVDEHNNRLELKTGDSIVELVNTIHHGENTGSEAVEIIVFYAGTTEQPITIVEGSIPEVKNN